MLEDVTTALFSSVGDPAAIDVALKNAIADAGETTLEDMCKLLVLFTAKIMAVSNLANDTFTGESDPTPAQTWAAQHILAGTLADTDAVAAIVRRTLQWHMSL